MSDATAEVDDEVDADENEDQPEGKKKLAGKKLVLFVILPVLLLLIVGGGGAAFFLMSGDEEEAAAAAQAEQAPVAQVVFYDLPEMLVNLNAGGKRANYLKLKVALELEKPEDVEPWKAILPRVVDNFQVYLREMRLEDLNGSAGLMRLKEELLMRTNVAAGSIPIRDVLFKEMLVQ
jgi:flagellar FliL protein